MFFFLVGALGRVMRKMGGILLVPGNSSNSVISNRIGKYPAGFLVKHVDPEEGHVG